PPSIARTRNVCWPSARLVKVAGELHAVDVCASSEHSKREPASLELKTKEAQLDATVPVGPESSVVSGGVVSVTTTVHATASGVRSIIPLYSDRAENVWTPGESPVYVIVLGQAV